MEQFETLDFNKISTYPINQRDNKVDISLFSTPFKQNEQICDIKLLGNLLPNILKGSDFKELISLIKSAKINGKTIMFAMGAHVIKCGLNPLIIDLMKRGYINSISVNGAFAIHDFELAYQGGTSEDVSKGLADGTFGMIKETGEFINNSLINEPEKGFGYCIGKNIVESNLKYRHLSVLGMGYEFNIPVTVHVAIGTDIVHQHPSANGKNIGIASYEDFKKISSIVASINNGGGFINFGSNVIIPEVFLKALTVARNLKPPVNNFFTANFDMISHYRPNENIVKRPVEKGGKGFNFVGHHEIMFPLLYAFILSSE